LDGTEQLVPTAPSEMKYRWGEEYWSSQENFALDERGGISRSRGTEQNLPNSQSRGSKRRQL